MKRTSSIFHSQTPWLCVDCGAACTLYTQLFHNTVLQHATTTASLPRRPRRLHTQRKSLRILPSCQGAAFGQAAMQKWAPNAEATLAVLLQAVCASARSFLGPEKAMKCIIDPGSDSKSGLVGTLQAYLLAADGDPTATTLLLEALDSQVCACGFARPGVDQNSCCFDAGVCRHGMACSHAG